MDKLIGEVIHFFNKAGVMVIKLDDKLSVGDTIKVKKKDKEFEQQVSSMQMEHEDVESAKAGQEIAIKSEQPVKEGYKVYKIES